MRRVRPWSSRLFKRVKLAVARQHRLIFVLLGECRGKVCHEVHADRDNAAGLPGTLGTAALRTRQRTRQRATEAALAIAAITHTTLRLLWQRAVMACACAATAVSILQELFLASLECMVATGHNVHVPERSLHAAAGQRRPQGYFLNRTHRRARLACRTLASRPRRRIVGAGQAFLHAYGTNGRRLTSRVAYLGTRHAQEGRFGLG